LLEALHFTAAPAAKEILDAVNVLKSLNADNTGKSRMMHQRSSFGSDGRALFSKREI